MSQPQYTVPYGKGELAFRLPSGFREATVAEHAEVAPLADVESSIRESLENPVGSAPLKELAGPGAHVCIVVTDSTRPCPDHLLVPPILTELEDAGVAREDVTILVGVGMHRASSLEEKESKLGPDVVANHRVYDSDPLDASNSPHFLSGLAEPVRTVAESAPNPRAVESRSPLVRRSRAQLLVR